MVARALSIVRPASDEEMSVSLGQNKAIFQEIAKTLMVSPDSEFQAGVKWVLQSLAQPQSPYCIPSCLPDTPALLRLSAKLSLANAIINSPGCTQARRAWVIGQVATGDFKHPPLPPSPQVSAPSRSSYRPR